MLGVFFKQSGVFHHITLTNQGMGVLPQSLSASLPDSTVKAEKLLLSFEHFYPSCKLTKACFSLSFLSFFKAHSQSVDHYLFTKAFRLRLLEKSHSPLPDPPILACTIKYP